MPCPCHVFTTTPSPGLFNQPGGIEVGFKFRADLDGYISGIRFLKDIQMTGPHTVSLWNNVGVRIAQAVSSGETATGWQEVNFTPVAVSANTLYTASVFSSDGKYVATSGYFNTPIVNAPLTAPQNGTVPASDGFGMSGQGIYEDDGTNSYPTKSFNAANYWVDVSFRGSPNSNPPTVTTTIPAANATSTSLGTNIMATFDMPMDSSTITASTFTVKDDTNTSVVGTVSYNSTSKRATFVPTSPLAPGKVYTATLKGGAGTVVNSLDGIALANDYVWSFTTVITDPCPCSLKGNVAPEGSTTSDDPSGFELGVKVVPQSNGYISKIRFYKPIISPDTTHTGNIWNAQGTKLASATFTNETEYGWQEATLASPLAVQQGEVYVISYGTPSGVYQASIGALNGTNIGSSELVAYATNDSRNTTAGSGAKNGAFIQDGVGSYPNAGNNGGSYYWVDAVFSSSNTISTPLTVSLTQPKNGAVGLEVNKKFTASFNKALNAGSVNGSNVKVYNKAGAQVTGTVAYNSGEHQVTFSPAGGIWATNEMYTVHLTTGVTATDSSALTSEYVTSFSTGGALNTDMTKGLGGPVLVITSNDNQYDSYYAEILRTEGITYFDVKDISSVNTALLANYRAVILSEMSLTQSQVDMFSNWVNMGGDFMAMHPDKKLAPLLGLQDSGTSRTNQYLAVNTSSAPGSGIVSSTIQFKGSADNYTNNGTQEVATLYSDAATPTTNPAATKRSVGSYGGTAMAFTYDLATSVIRLHQGNPAWAGQERDGDVTKRSNDLFYGNKAGDVQPDWVDMNKIHIPQADEQQRLLINMLSEATKDIQPLPRFWYLPHETKAAIVFAGDDHGIQIDGGTERHLNDWLNESGINCSVIDWECIRASHYIYDDVPITNTRAVQYDQLGFEIGEHPSNSKGCGNVTSYSDLNNLFVSNFAAFRAKFPGLANQTTDRFHCYLWGDWDGTAKASVANGIHYGLDYVAYPSSWINGRSPLITGSGMNMRLTDVNGALLDIYQGVTNFDNTATNLTSINATLDNALGSTGYYGMFGSHYDMVDQYDRTLLSAAKAHNVPLISSKQAQTWLDGRGSSRFDNLASTNQGKLTFTLIPGQGTVGLRSMIPKKDSGGTVTTISRDSGSISFTNETIKGVDYAVFDAQPGDYTVMYSDYDPNPRTIPGSGSNGSDGGATTDSGSTSQQSTAQSKTQTQKKSSVSHDDGVLHSDDLVALDQPVNTGDSDKDTSPQSDEKADSKDASVHDTKKDETVVMNWLWLSAIIPVLGLIWLAFKRFHHKSSSF